MKATITLVAIIVLQAALFGQQQGGLLYTCRYDEQSNQSTAGLVAINNVEDKEVQYVWPDATGAPYTSKQWAPLLGYNMLVGDYDGDGSYYDPNLFGRIDALLRPRTEDGGMISTPLNMRLLFFSPRDDVITVRPPLGPPYSSNLLRSDVGRIIPGVPGGPAVAFEIFLSEAQVRTAFGIPAATVVNVDAVCLHLDPDWDPDHQGIYLSFENTQTITIGGGAITVLDGAILRIPASAISWLISAYDGESVLVQSVAPNSGQVILIESDVDAMVGNSLICDNGGTTCGTVTDVDGLTLPDDTGYFKSQWTPGPIHHLWFSGFRMTGAGICSTVGGGSIPTLNGVPMGSPVVTTGAQVGLVPGNVRSLAGLALTPKDLAHFVTDSPTPFMAGPGTIRVQFGGAAAVPGTILLWNLGNNIPGGVDVGAPIVPSAAFPEYYSHILWNLVVIGADDCGEWTFPITPGAYATLSGMMGNLRFQGFIAFLVPPYWLSTPMKIQF